MSSLLDSYLSVVRKFIPEKVVKPSVGIDIGSNTCKAVEVLHDKSGAHVLNYAIEPIDQIDPANTIRKILATIKPQQNCVHAAISGHGTLTRYVDMPKMALSDLRQSVMLEADKHFPFSKDEIYTDCFILDEQSSSSTMPILIAAAKKEIIDKRLQLFSRLGYQLDFVTLNTMATANLFNVLVSQGAHSSHGQTENTPSITAVLDMGHAITSLVIIKNGIPRFSRDMFIGSRDFTKRISNVFGVGTAEAEQIKCDPKDKVDDIHTACESIIMNLSNEIRLSFDYVATEYNYSISKILVTGGGAGLTDIQRVFSRSIDIPTEIWNPLEAFMLPEDSKDNLEQNAHRLGVALGLGLFTND